MRATLLDVHALTTDAQHHAFTSLALWRGHLWCAWRQAFSHGIVPAGQVVISQREACLREERAWHLASHPQGDVRDPRLIATDEALYCIVGVYLPAPQHLGFQGLSVLPAENLIVSHLTYTTDGQTWSPLIPIGRVNTWLWSAVRLTKGWVACGYYGGRAGEDASLALYTGRSLWDLAYAGMIYDGASYEREGDDYRYPHRGPCEPVLWQPTEGTLACAVRTESGMDMGVSRAPYTHWRWHQTTQPLHPSAVLQTMHGWVLAARHVETREEHSQGDAPQGKERLIQRTLCTTRLYWFPPGQHTPCYLLTLPSEGDCGYAGLSLGEKPHIVHASYYTQGPPDAAGVRLPGATVKLATVHVAA